MEYKNVGEIKKGLKPLYGLYGWNELIFYELNALRIIIY